MAWIATPSVSLMLCPVEILVCKFNIQEINYNNIINIFELNDLCEVHKMC